jgi:hypothetical protein
MFMRIATAQRIDGILTNEVFPSFIVPMDLFRTLEHKMRELETVSRSENKPAIEKCSFEIAAITIKFLESGLVSP